MHTDSTLNLLLRLTKSEREKLIKRAKQLALWSQQTVEEALEYLLERRFGG